MTLLLQTYFLSLELSAIGQALSPSFSRIWFMIQKLEELSPSWCLWAPSVLRLLYDPFLILFPYPISLPPAFPMICLVITTGLVSCSPLPPTSAIPPVSAVNAPVCSGLTPATAAAVNLVTQGVCCHVSDYAFIYPHRPLVPSRAIFLIHESF